MLKHLFLLAPVLFGLLLPAHGGGVAKHVVLVVWDGMRPDFVSPELTPALWQLRTNGTWFARHHSAYPTSTEVNGATLATGAHPQHSGVLANLEFRPAIKPAKIFGTEELAVIRQADAQMEGRYLAVPTLAEMLHAQNRQTAVAGTKAVAVFFDRAERNASNASGRSFSGTNALPASLWPELINRLGKPPESDTPNSRRDEWTARGLIEHLWAAEVPAFSVLWLSEPDATQHKFGPGSPMARVAIRGSDRNLALVLRELERRGLRDQTDVMVVSDHGFSTVEKSVDVVKSLNRAGLKVFRSFTNAPNPDDTLLVVNGGSLMLYVTGHSTNTIQRTVAALQTESCSGVIFTRAGLPGTFPLREVRLDAPHAPDIIVSLQWSSATANNGTLGLFTRDGVTAVSTLAGMHTSLAPTDLHNLCVAAGPDFRAGFTNTIATGNIDVMPTLSWALGVEAYDADGRILFEALKHNYAQPTQVEQKKLEARVGLPTGNWSQYLSVTEVNGVRYFEEGGGGFVPNPTNK
jgi:arylsulfatase A-like enzyme